MERIGNAIEEAEAIVAPAYRDTILLDAPAAYWRLDETSGAAAADASGNARNGTYNGTYTLGVVGGLSDANAAVTFTGTTGEVTTVDADAFSPLFNDVS